MKLGGILTAVMVMAAPAAFGQAHGLGMAHGGAGVWHGGGGHMHGGPGRGHGGHDHFFHNHFHGHNAAWAWYYPPYWDDMGDQDTSDNESYAEAPTPDLSCGGWVAHGERYAWRPDACRSAPADPPQPALASNECSDWVWRADLHHSICKRGAYGTD
jgi:hypothetical protein